MTDLISNTATVFRACYLAGLGAFFIHTLLVVVRRFFLDGGRRDTETGAW